MARERIWSAKRLLHRLAAPARAVALIVCFGTLGLIWSLPWMRRRSERKAANCTVCRRHRTWARVFVSCFVVAQAVGVAAFVFSAADPPLRCHAHLYADGQVRDEPLLPNVSPAGPWNITRQVIEAPISGLTLLSTTAAGMRDCGIPPLGKVVFWLPPRNSSGGSVVGGVFVAWMPANREYASLLQGLQGFGLAPESRGSAPQTYLRYGPNMSATRDEEIELSRHESRHIDQWAVATILGGPLAFPAAYVTDNAFFPLNRNHFERAAGLDDGGYSPPPDNLPAPLLPEALVVVVVLLLVLRRRIRWCSRILVGGRAGGAIHAPGRCPLHTTGWLHQPSRRAAASGDQG